MWAHLLSAAVGAWLTAAPGLLGYAGAAAANFHVVGPLVATFGLIAAFQVTRPLRWANLALGGWLVLSPLFLGLPPGPVVNGTACGLLVGALACVRGRRTERFGGGWSAIWRADQLSTSGVSHER